MLPTRRPRLDDPLRSERSCVLARRGLVCTSVPAAGRAGLAMLHRGGNAVDAALAAAATLTVVEPMQNGLGGDAFALLWSAREGRLVGLNGSGRAPAAATLEAYRRRGLDAVPERGVLAATVPGAVHAWQSLSEAYGALPLADCLEPAVRAAEEGFPVTEIVAHYWHLLHATGALRNEAARAALAPGGRTPAAGELFRAPGLAATLRAVQKRGAPGLYEGPVADAIVATVREEGGFLAREDLASHRSSWVEPLRADYRGTTVAELPPSGQGVTALQALGILAELDPAEAPPGSALEWHRRIEAVKLAFADRDAYVADPARARVPVEALLDPAYAARRAAHVGERALPGAAPGLGGDTVYLCTADAEGNLVSFIQSLFKGFGSGVGCGETGVVLQNRGHGFSLDPAHPNALEPGKRPFHTIIPGMLLRREEGGGAGGPPGAGGAGGGLAGGGEGGLAGGGGGGVAPWMAFGIMGGDVQPQAHATFVSNLVDWGMNPQEALDRARFRYESGARVRVETPEAPVREGGTLGEALAARGHEVIGPGAAMADVFGGGQAAMRLENGVLAGASDRRKDGGALGLD